MNDLNFDLDIIGHTAAIVCAALGGSRVIVPSENSDLIASTHRSLVALGQPPVVAEPTVTLPTAREVRASIQDDALVSFIDGKRYKMLRRHLSLNGHTPESYRAAFGLPASYPMTSPDYSAKRRQLAIDNGLGRKGKA